MSPTFLLRESYIHVVQAEPTIHKNNYTYNMFSYYYEPYLVLIPGVCVPPDELTNYMFSYCYEPYSGLIPGVCVPPDKQK